MNFNERIIFLKNTVQSLERGLTKNAITEDVRTEVEGRIAQLRELISEIESLRDAAAAGDNDNSEELMVQVKEVMARLTAVENILKTGEQVKNTKVVKTKEYRQKFFQMVQNSMNKDDFKNGLKKLAIENSITITDGDISELLPAAVLNEVNDTFINHRHRLLEVVDWTGLPVFKSMFETGNEVGHTWPSEMLGQTASETAKKEQALSFVPVVIRPQFVYKTLSLDKEVIKASEADGSVFLRYVVRELLERLLCTIEGYILTGNANNFIAPTEVEVVSVEDVPQYHALNYLPYNGGLVAICTPAFYIEEKQRLMRTLGYYISDEFMAKDYFGVNEVIMTPPSFRTEGNQVGLFFLNPRAYKMVGDRRPDQYEDFNLSWNRVEYLMEMWVGGGCVNPEFISLKKVD